MISVAAQGANFASKQQLFRDKHCKKLTLTLEVALRIF
jgi:hypothetical protein